MMHYLFILLILTVELCSAAAYYYVDIAEGNDLTIDGSNPATPFKNITAAVNFADNPSNGTWTIYVKSGSYPESDGGYNAIALESQTSGDSGSFIGVSDFETKSPGSVIINGTRNSCVLNASAMTTGTLLFENFTFSGKAAGTYLSSVYTGSCSKNTTFRNCTFQHLGDGGDYSCMSWAPAGGTLTLENCQFKSPPAGAVNDHQAVIANLSKLIITKCTFEPGLSGRYYRISNCAVSDVYDNIVQDKIEFDYKCRVIKVHDNFCTTAQNKPFFGVNSEWTFIQRNITNITRANPAVVTTAIAHNLNNGDKIQLYSIEGMDELNINNPYEYYVVANKTTYAFELTSRLGLNIDSTYFTPYASQGQVIRVNPMAYRHKVMVYNNYAENTNPNPNLLFRGPFLVIRTVEGAFVYGNTIHNGSAQAIHLTNCLGSLVMHNYVEGQDSITLAGGRGNHVVNNTLIGEKGAALFLCWHDGGTKGLYTNQNTIINNVLITDEATNNFGDHRGPFFLDGEGWALPSDDPAENGLNFVDYNWYWSNDANDFTVALFDGERLTSLAALQSKWSRFSYYPIGNDVHSFVQPVRRDEEFNTDLGAAAGMPRQVSADGRVSVSGDIGATKFAGPYPDLFGGADINRDGSVDLIDLMFFGQHWLEKAPLPNSD